MGRISAWMAAIVCLASALPAAAKAKKPNPAAVALFEKALATSDIEAKGSPSFRLQATVQTFDAKGQHIDGTLVELWTSDGKWREETTLQGHEFVEVSDGHHLWAKNAAGFVPFGVHELWAALAFAARLRWWLGPGTTPFTAGGVMELPFPPQAQQLRLDKPKIDRKRGRECVDVDDRGALAGESCFDQVTGEVLQEMDSEGFLYEYSNYKPFGQKSFPRTLRVLAGRGMEPLELHIDELDPLAAVPAELFLAPRGSQEAPAPVSCGRVTSMKMVKQLRPAIPRQVEEERVQGTTVLYGYLGTDGVLRGVLALRSPSPLLAAAFSQALSQSRFRPAVCDAGGVARPAAVATYVTIISAAD